MEYKYHEYLDIVLKALKEHNELNPISDVSLLEKSGIKDLSKRDGRILIDKLKKDGAAAIIEANDIITFDGFYITFEGLLLLESGGYIQQQKNMAISKARQLAETRLIAGGAAVAGVYYFVELLRHLFRFLLGCH